MILTFDDDRFCTCRVSLCFKISRGSSTITNFWLHSVTHIQYLPLFHNINYLSLVEPLHFSESKTSQQTDNPLVFSPILNYIVFFIYWPDACCVHLKRPIASLEILSHFSWHELDLGIQRNKMMKKKKKKRSNKKWKKELNKKSRGRERVGDKRKTYLSVVAESTDHDMHFELIGPTVHPNYSTTLVDHPTLIQNFESFNKL